MKRIALGMVAVMLCLSCAVRAGEVELRFAWWGGAYRHENTLKVIKMFEDANPGVTIKGEYMGWDGYLVRLTTQIGANAEPDLMQINWAWIEMFSPKGDGFLNMGPHADALNLKDFTQDALASGISGGVQNALPIAMGTRYFMYNKTTWDKAGLAIPKTWDDLLKAGPVFKEKLGDAFYPIDMEPIEGLWILDAWLYEKFGGEIIDNKEPKMGVTVEQLTEGLTFMKQLLDNHSVVPAPLRTSVAGQYEKVSEQIAEYVNGTWAGGFSQNTQLDLKSKGSAELGMEMVLGQMLTQDGNPKPDRIGRPAMMYALSKNTEHPEIAAKFLGFLMTNPEAAKAMGMARGLPVSKTQYQTLVDANMLSKLTIDAQNQMEGSKYVYCSGHVENERIRTIILSTMEELFHGKATPAETAASMHEQCTSALERIIRNQ
jgi:oligogalacturonide transport system substrate-binding protein